MLASISSAPTQEKQRLGQSEPAVIMLEKGKSYPVPPASPNPVIANKKQVERVLLRQRLSVWALALQQLKNPFSAYSAVKKLRLYSEKPSGKAVQKLVHVDGKYHTDLSRPAWPSVSFEQYTLKALTRLKKTGEPNAALQSLYLAITRQHVQGDNHFTNETISAQQELLSLQQLKEIVKKYQEEGVMQIQLSGGEPLLRYADMLELLASANKNTDFWLVTSGHSMTLEKAQELKRAGLVGVSIKLDHFDPEEYNSSRGYKHAYGWVLKAAEQVRKANLVLCLNLSITPAFISEENLYKYAKLAKGMGASFIQLLEPGTPGHAKQKGAELKEEQQKVLDAFVDRMNFDKEYHDWPLVACQGWHQRNAGRASVSNHTIYIGTDGGLNTQPASQNKAVEISRDRQPFGKNKAKMKR